jgi:hypothetical protein
MARINSFTQPAIPFSGETHIEANGHDTRGFDAQPGFNAPAPFGRIPS